ATRYGRHPSFKAYLAVSASVATVAELAMGERVTTRALAVSELRGGTWNSAAWPTVDSFDGVVSSNGRATFVMHKQNVPMLYLISEQ
ncbi:MAG TPA: hypothetical protein VFU36_09635, partial [Jatrophihabitans sp.]|nr:hypothetical protein [Jatrophihabitans sp.]